MLVISRKVDERVVIGDLGDGGAAVIQSPGPIVITVVRITADKVRLGIEAAPDVPVHREEIAQRIAAERGGAVQPAA